MPAQRTQCEEGGAASVSTSVNQESVYPDVRHTRSYGHKKNKSICTESSHSGPVGASGLWSLVIVHWFIDQSASRHITDVRIKHIRLNVRIKNAFMCSNKWIRGKYTAWARDQTVRSINKGLSWPSWDQIKAFPDSRIDWLIDSFSFYPCAPASSVDTEHRRPSTSSGVLEHVAVSWLTYISSLSYRNSPVCPA